MSDTNRECPRTDRVDYDLRNTKVDTEGWQYRYQIMSRHADTLERELKEAKQIIADFCFSKEHYKTLEAGLDWLKKVEE